MEAYDIRNAFSDLGEVEFRTLATFNRGAVGVFLASSGTSPWERHPDDEALLPVVEGSVDELARAFTLLLRWGFLVGAGRISDVVR